MTTQIFNPPKRTLMGPGPSDVPPSVLKAMGQSLVGHLDPSFIGMMEEYSIDTKVSGVAGAWQTGIAEDMGACW